MAALAIRDDIGSEEPRRRARRESDGRISAREGGERRATMGIWRRSGCSRGWFCEDCSELNSSSSLTQTQKWLISHQYW